MQIPPEGALPHSASASAPLQRLHMGCGQTFLEGWINCDGSPSARLRTLLPRPLRWLLQRSGLLRADTRSFWRFLDAHEVVYMNAHKVWPFADESIDIIYTSHMLDCFALAEGHHFFQQAYRVLKPGGQIRLVGMNLAKEVQVYLQQQDAERLVGMISYPNPCEGSLFARVWRALRGEVLYRTHYDFGSYRIFLQRAGFDAIRQLPPGETRIAHLEPVNLWQRQGESLYVEARKPEVALPGRWEWGAPDEACLVPGGHPDE